MTPMNEGRRLYVGGLPKISTQLAVNVAIREIFKGWDVLAISKIIPPHVSKQALPGSHHYCFVDLSSAEEAQSAVRALDGRRMPTGDALRVRVSRPRWETKVMREQLGGNVLDRSNWRRSGSSEEALEAQCPTLDY